MRENMNRAEIKRSPRERSCLKCFEMIDCQILELKINKPEPLFLFTPYSVFEAFDFSQRIKRKRWSKKRD
jgi:hypothetical protein